MIEQLIFFSYSRKDGAEFASRLAADLSGMGANVWIDKQGIQPGTDYFDEIEKGMTECTHVLYILTKEALKSRNVKNELAYANDENKTIIPLRIQKDCKVPLAVKSIQFIDFIHDYASGLDELTKSLNLKKSSPPKKPPDENTTYKPTPKYIAPSTPYARQNPLRPRVNPILPRPIPRFEKNISDKLRKEGFPANLSPGQSASSFQRGKSYVYEFEKDATWWLVFLPVAIILSTTGIYFGTKLFNYLLSLWNFSYLQYYFSWTLIIISGIVWGIASAIVGGSSATIKSELAFGFFVPFANIFSPMNVGDFLRGLFTSFFINIILISAVSAGLAFLGHNFFSWSYVTVFLASYISISVLSIIGFLSEDTL